MVDAFVYLITELAALGLLAAEEPDFVEGRQDENQYDSGCEEGE
jgi:hypothetical protein